MQQEKEVKMASLTSQAKQGTLYLWKEDGDGIPFGVSPLAYVSSLELTLTG